MKARLTCRAWILPVPFFVLACAPTEGDAKQDPWTEGEPTLLHPRAKTAALYAESTIVDFDVGFTEDAWLAFVAAWKPLKNKSTWFHCSFQFLGVRFLDAACRHKATSAKPASEKKPPLIVRFDKWDDTGRFFGVRQINLEANPDYPAPVRDRLGMWIMRRAGLMAPRVNHARVTLNGQPLGLYQNIEIIDHEFLEQRFDPPIGNLYEQDRNGWNLRTNGSTGNTKPVSDLETLLTAWKAAPSAALEEQLEATVDVGQVLRETAAEMVLPVCDNFSNGGYNFYLYQMADSRLVLLPWDLDEAISDRAPPDADPWTFLGNLANSNRFPAIGFHLRAMLFANPSWRAEYESDMLAVRDGAYGAAKDRLAQVCDQIRSHVADDPAAYGTIAEFDGDCGRIAERIAERSAYLRDALGR